MTEAARLFGPPPSGRLRPRLILSSPPRAGPPVHADPCASRTLRRTPMPRIPSPGGSRRYRRVTVTYTVARERVPKSWPTLSSPEAAAAFGRELVAAHDDDRERFWVIFLNAQNGYTGHHLVSIGSLSASIVHPREVLGPALREGAAHLILVHNHPSSDPTPSKEDIQLMGQLVEGARLLRIRVHDHVVIGNGTAQWVSLAQRGLL